MKMCVLECAPHCIFICITDARKSSDPLGADLGTGRTELEKGRITPETLAADEEQDGAYSDSWYLVRTA